MLRIRVPLTAAVLALAAGCGAGPAVSGTPSSAGGGTETAAAPATEDPGPTATASGPRPTGPALTLPEVPIGRAGRGDDAEGPVRCTTVQYLGDSPIPDGVRVVVQKAGVEQDGDAYFTADGAGCAGATPCAHVTWTESTRTDVCSVRLRETGRTKPPDDDTADPRVVLSARLDCPAGQEAACAAFRDDVRDDDRQVRVTPPFADVPSPTATGN